MSTQQILIQEFRRRVFDESYPRILHCLDLLSEEEIWDKPNDSTNSVGNLVLHVCGNAKQWVLSGLGGRPDSRDRDAEFAHHTDITKAELILLLKTNKAEVNEVLSSLGNDDLTQERHVQGFQETGVSVLTHVMEHFSYHCGQIALLTKLQRNQDLGFYTGVDLNAKGVAAN